ncbi:FAD-dependent monooxygenase [Tsukamurella sp. 1534]|uniref:FAD-dependent monooxygenase n=1 Tax=Tsukamurella sp. 1534 TaxID=1151061 RepID=UPI0003030180|nr:FAD-dependent monooxygenase [Tsukamurella sp. 1534]
MTCRTVAIIGGGPAGLAAARLIKLRSPDASVTVYERADSSTGTFGFGVGLTEATMRNVAAVDPDLAERMRSASHAGHNLVLRTDSEEVHLHGARNLAIGRAILLEVLADAAREVGVSIRMGARVDESELEADVIVAADGARSAVREKLQAELGVHVAYGALHYMWCGTDFAVENAHFTWRTRGDGLFVVHAYPYTDDRSTFLIEVDAHTWESARLAENHRQVAPGESDRRSLDLLEDVFSDELRGRPLLANRTRWAQFPTVSLDRWSAGNVVLLGDAAHTAHYTIGSGTKLALEDAISLADALGTHADVRAAFEAYEAARRPGVEKFKHLAARSQAWWSSFRDRSARRPEEIALSYMTRAGNIGVADYAREYPDNARIALAYLGDAPVHELERLDDWVLSRPLETDEFSAPSRIVKVVDLPETTVRRWQWTGGDAWNAEHDAAVEELRGAAERILVLGGDGTAASVGARIDIAERVRWAGRHTVVVEMPATARSEAASAVAARRVDAAILTD